MCDFMTEYIGCRHPAMKIGMYIILCVLTVWQQMHPCLKSNVQEAWAHAFYLLVLQVLPSHVQGLHVPYNTLACTLHVY